MNGGMQERTAAVRARIRAACARAGRAEESVRLVAVSKTYPPGIIREAARCGCACFGESRVHEAAAKMDACPGGLDWHFVGHLQRNKVRSAIRLFSMFHAVDSIRLLDRIDESAAEAGRRPAVCLEVNVSGEVSKYGLAPAAVPEVLAHANGLKHVSVEGLMTMAPFSLDPEEARPCFRRLRELRDRWAVESGLTLETLSMGMSGDFETAIEEGATLIRVGTVLFGPRPAGEGDESCV